MEEKSQSEMKKCVENADASPPIGNSEHKHYLRTVEAPIVNATTLVNDVTVIDAPACCSIRAIFSGMDRWRYFASFCRQHAIMTKISSTPKPNIRNGRHVCTGPYETPNTEHMPTVETNAIPMLSKVMLAKIS